ncbi:hypothetical protein AAW51_1657 [Caldimonas brevitalea]|uniref:Uncharacterized protein n=1 Tax=Caldimonas brevitalea TaxID=413882 RepID=A0A0G3BK43_9BURK|nr:hypothetical protein AAW51_1657 [Caldimonas brevitalea]
MTDGTANRAVGASRSQASPTSSETLPSGIADQPTGRSAGVYCCRAFQTSSGTSTRTRKRFSGKSSAFRCTTDSRQASAMDDAV